MNIFVAGLSYQISEAELSQVFEEYGEVSSARIITDKETRRSKGYGFVEMPNDDEAKHAISELNDAELAGRTLSVSEARPREERPQSRERNFRSNNRFTHRDRHER